MFWKKKKAANAELQIIYGTETGNAKLVAKHALRYYSRNGVKATCINMSKVNPSELSNSKYVLVVVSTHGEGDPPQQAKKFFIQLMNAENLNYSQVNYSICALGDSGYDQFCFAGKNLDARFSQLGATAFFPRVDCDLEFTDKAINWIKQSFEAYKKKNKTKAPTEKSEDVFEILTKQSFYHATLIDKVKLSSDLNPDEVFHLTFKLNENNLDYKPGDSIKIIPRNPESLVEKIIEKLPQQKNGTDLRNYLLDEAEITSLQLSTLEKYQVFANDSGLKQLLENKESRLEYIKQANFYDLITDYPFDLSDETLKQILPKLKSRVYSIASSQKKNSGNLDLTVKTVRYNYKQAMHEGSGSVFINEKIEAGMQLKFALERSPSFAINNDSGKPIIMIAVGTGIAPFRTFLQEVELSNSKNNLWLIWGIKYKEDYSLYKSELQEQLSKGIINHLDIAYSKILEGSEYVQDKILKKSDQLNEYIQAGAHIYVCGSIKMGKDVDKTLESIFQQNQLGSFEDFETSGRYHTDVY
jgi:sulfite reductase (NADPH) flavoprotein alpha-component